AKTSVQATKASVENLNLLQAGRGEIAFTLGDSLSDAWKGSEDAGFKTPLKKLRGIAAIYPNYIQIVARADAGIKTLADLKGKKVSVGAPKSGTELNARVILGAAGMSYKDFAKVEYLPFGESVELMKNRQIDVTLQSAGLGVSALRDLATSVDIVVVAIPADVIKKTNDPAYLPAVIPANTYRGQTADVPAAAVQNFLVTHEGVSDDVVYGMTKALWTSLDQLVAAHSAAKAIDLKHALEGMPVPLHPAALAFSAYQLYIAAFSPLSSLVTRSLHVGFLMLLAFLIYPVGQKAARDRIAWYDAAIAVLAFVLAFYHWVFEADLIQRSGDATVADLVVGAVVIVLLFDAARRVLGIALPIVCATFLAYGVLGQYLPSAIAHRGYGFDQIIGQLYLGSEGIYGIPTLVSATYIFLFILFGSFLEHAGMIGLFNNIALGFVGHARGGPAKVAVISSGMMGMISGSGIANVMTIGQFTIPLMKRFGYSSVFAGAVEATSSMGGQIMPPVMGAVAFIMAETLNVPYVTIVKAAVIPAFLYYLTAFWMVHLEAGRARLFGLPKSECPNPWRAIAAKWHLLLPLVVLVALLFDGWTPMFAGLVGLALTAILILGAGIVAGFGSTHFRVVFWVVLGVGLAVYLKQGFDQYGIGPILALIGVFVAWSLVAHGG